MNKTIQAREHRFVARLEQFARGGYFAVEVPERISTAIGKRGPIPVTATVNNLVEFTASLSPAGGGRHRLRLNTHVREEAGAKPGDAVKVRLEVLAQPQMVAIPNDFKSALRAEGVLEFFETFAPGKKNHIIGWIDEAARPETREKRIQYTIEVTHMRQDKRTAREATRRSSKAR